MLPYNHSSEPKYIKGLFSRNYLVLCNFTMLASIFRKPWDMKCMCFFNWGELPELAPKIGKMGIALGET